MNDDILLRNPVYEAGGTVEIRELPKDEWRPAAVASFETPRVTSRAVAEIDG
jgi:hypothetical protein